VIKKDYKKLKKTHSKKVERVNSNEDKSKNQNDSDSVHTVQKNQNLIMNPGNYFSKLNIHFGTIFSNSN
jgi:hypothetical protein